MTTTNEMIDTWLRDAHATEAQAATMLRGTARRNEDYPRFGERLAEQAERCDANARAIDACLNARGSGPSLIKDGIGQVTALGQSFSGAVLGDEIVKAALATTTFARMQAASARSLVAAATQQDDAQTASTCGAILEAHEGFASDIDAMLPTLTTEYLARDCDDGTAAETSSFSEPSLADGGTNESAIPGQPGRFS